MKVKYLSITTGMAKLCVAIFCLTSISGCGFYSFTGASIPPDTKTFSVANFTNMSQDAVMPGLTNILTEGLKDLFLKQTKLSLVQSDGDFAFEGEVRSYQVNPTAITSNDVAAQERLTITVKIVFKNKHKTQQKIGKSTLQRKRRIEL